MTNTEKYLDSIDGPQDADLFALDTEDDDLFAPTVTTEDEDEDYLDFDSNYADDRYGEGRNGMPSWSLFA